MHQWTDEELYEKKVKALSNINELINMMLDNHSVDDELFNALHDAERALETDTGKTVDEHIRDLL